MEMDAALKEAGSPGGWDRVLKAALGGVATRCRALVQSQTGEAVTVDPHVGLADEADPRPERPHIVPERPLPDQQGGMLF